MLLIKPLLADFREGSVAWLIQRYLDEMNGWAGKPAVRPMLHSQLRTLRLIQRSPKLSAVSAPELREHHLIEHCKARVATGRKPATVQQDVTFLVGAYKYALPVWKDCGDLAPALAALIAVKPFLAKHNLIGRSQPRTERPTDEQHERLKAYFAKQNGDRRTKINMVEIAEWQRIQGMRISNTCRLEWGHWNRAEQTMLLTKMKDPRRRNRSKVVALTEEAQSFLIEKEARRLRPGDPTEKIFPYYEKSCGARYTLAKKALGIVNLHLHDSRRDLSARLVEELGLSKEQAIGVTGHETTREYERTYMKVNPATIARLLIERREKAEA